MVVRVQKSKEDGLDFSLALSFYLLFKISKSEAQEISGPLSRVAIVFGGKRCGAVVLFSRDKKKKEKKSWWVNSVVVAVLSRPTSTAPD